MPEVRMESNEHVLRLTASNADASSETILSVSFEETNQTQARTLSVSG
jgi:hypothetical protein